MNKKKVLLRPLQAEDREQFILDNQEAFRYGALEEFGCRDTHFEEDGEIISRETIGKSIDTGEAYRIICDGQIAGGTLYQDIPSEVEEPLVHLHTPPENPVTHDVVIEPDTPLASVIQEQKIHVNSFHHQGVKELSSKLKCMARATDGVLEAAYMPGKRFVWGVQWHPEMSYQTDENSLKIFRAFVSCAKKDK